jgi:hypothetical protein
MSAETLTCEEVAQQGLVERFVSGRLPEAEGEAFEAHLLECEACREETRIAMTLREEFAASPSAPGKTGRLRSRPWWLAGVAAAAAVFIMVLVRTTANGIHDSPVVRGTGDEGLPAVTIIGPTAATRVSRAGLVFVWHSAGKSAAYKVTLTNETGDVVWKGATADTIQRPPNSVRLERRAIYFWYVDALLPDGRSAISAVQRFSVE